MMAIMTVLSPHLLIVERLDQLSPTLGDSCESGPLPSKGDRNMSGPVQDILRRAGSVGIRLRLDGSKVKAILPDSNDPRVLDVVEQLRQHRDEVRSLLQVDDDQLPIRPCYTCGGLAYWRRPTGGYVCEACHPNPHELILASRRIQ